MAKKKAKGKSPQPRRIDLTPDQMQDLLKRVKDRMEDRDYEVISAMTETIQVLSQALEEKTTSIKRLLRYLFGAPTETAKNILPEDDSGSQGSLPSRDSEKEEKPRPKGHGRNGASSYTGAPRVKIPHPTLKSGDPCSLCLKGKVYELSLPSLVVRIVGTAPLQATVFELARLRCNLCGAIFTAPAPEKAAQAKYDDSAASMIAVLKYGCGMPFYRLEKLQRDVGMPVPASTQWEVLEAASKVVEPVHGALIHQAAQGDVLHNDDTTARILDYLREQDPPNGRTGIFTTGIVSIKDGRRIALFMTGRSHAGENLDEVLKARASGLSPPIQMCDALDRNVPKGLKTILANCNAHGRRYFVDLLDPFPQECRHVIELLAKVYHNEDMVSERGLDPHERLAFHQSESGPVMGELKTWCEEQFSLRLVEPNSGLGKAIQYLLNHWEKLTRFLHVPGAPLDNNICERALKLAVLHRKNALFFKTQNGAHVGDIFMSLIHTCQLAGENPFEYLTALLRNASKVAEHPERWLPWNYRATLSSQR